MADVGPEPRVGRQRRVIELVGIGLGFEECHQGVEFLWLGLATKCLAEKPGEPAVERHALRRCDRTQGPGLRLVVHKRIVEQQQRLPRHVRRFPPAHRAGGLGCVEHHHHVVLGLALAVLIDAATTVRRAGATAEIGRARVALDRLVELA